MPVTATLSKKFYEKLGEDVTNELVNWFNTVDATYRTDLRELNETNFRRFDARIGERMAELRGEMGERMAELRGEMKAELAQLDAKLERRVAELKTEIGDRLRSLETRLVRWMLGFWVSTLIGLGALFFRR